MPANKVELRMITSLLPTQSVQVMSTQKLIVLKDSILREGLKVPPVVYKYNGKWYILNGHHRVLASLGAGLKKIPCMVLTKKSNLGYCLEEVEQVKDSWRYDWEDARNSILKYGLKPAS